MTRTVRLSVGLLAVLWAQKSFEGSITYTTKVEGAMAAQMGEMIKSQMPDKMIVYYRGNKVRSEVGDAVVLTDGDAGFIYLLNPALKTYRKAPLTPPQESDQAPTPKVVKTKDKAKVAGYAVERYDAEVSTPQGEIKMQVWAAPALKVSEIAQRGNNLARGVKVDGIPLRIVMDVPGIDIKIVFLATQVQTTPPEEVLFKIPTDYVEEKEAND
ncbi:MAG: DUF4412 domain-containing protein [Bacteroidia bacterium]|nr:DUF4412 domain-containing protein [Bacteroidia bacterium]MCX7651527.1 DUF4412 domain-containing protein [Bacteroidia bacterium]MDW8416824.1 DUF4412 domain-containing protein [Bacteroidia bacterium]